MDKPTRGKKYYQNLVSTEEGRRRHNATMRQYYQTEKWKSYNKRYQRERLKDEINKRIHSLTCFGERVLRYRHNNLNSQIGRLPYHTIYWIRETYLQAKREGKCVNHICQIQHLVRFSQDIPIWVVFDPINLEIVSKEENSSYGDRVTERTLRIAKKLQNRHSECRGLYMYFKRLMKGEEEQ